MHVNENVFKGDVVMILQYQTEKKKNNNHFERHALVEVHLGF